MSTEDISIPLDIPLAVKLKHPYSENPNLSNNHARLPRTLELVQSALCGCNRPTPRRTPQLIRTSSSRYMKSSGVSTQPYTIPLRSPDLLPNAF